MKVYGAGSEDALAFHLQVYHLVTQVPRGKVTTYGHIAYLAAKPDNSRQVGYALKHLSNDTSMVYNSTNVPWWRIIGAHGAIPSLSTRAHHKEALEQEVPVTEDGKVDLATYGWFPADTAPEIDYDFRVPEGFEFTGRVVI